MALPNPFSFSSWRISSGDSSLSAIAIELLLSWSRMSVELSASRRRCAAPCISVKVELETGPVAMAPYSPILSWLWFRWFGSH